MKRILPLLALVVLCSACDDTRLNLDPEWYLAGGGEQQLFKQIKLTRNDHVGAKALPTSTIVTITSDKLVTKSVVAADENGTLNEVCSESAVVDGLEYQAFTALLAEAKMIDYVQAEDAVCPEVLSYNYEISYLRMDGKSAEISSLAETCPLPEVIVAVITQVESIANSSVAGCQLEAAEPVAK